MTAGYLERTGVTTQTEQRSAAEIERYAAHMDFMRWWARRDRPSIRSAGWHPRSGAHRPATGSRTVLGGALPVVSGSSGARMNYYEARQRSDKSGWAWTGMNDGRIFTAGGCVTWPDGEPTVDQALSGNGPKPGEPHSHATREEAERCFYEYETAHLREHTYTSAHGCEYPVNGGRCGKWTPTTLEPDGGVTMVFLCDDHRSPDGYRLVRPFVPGIRISSSW